MADLKAALETPRLGSHSNGWSTKDLLVLGTLTCRALCISRLPYLPISPIVAFSFLLLIACFQDLKRVAPALRQSPVFIAYIMLVGIQILGTLLNSEWNYETISKVGRILSAAVFVASLIGYLLSKPEIKFARVMAVFIGSLVASALWFLLEITITEPFVGLRLQIYADNYVRFDWTDEGEFTRSGLCPFLHIMGYQLSFLLSVLLVTESRYLRQPFRTLRFFALIIGGAALYFSSQRSAFFAAALTVLLFIFFSPKHRPSGRVIALILSIIAVLAVTTSLDVWETDYLQVSITEKLIDTQHWNEAIFRLKLQWQALKVIISNPLGLKDLATDWVDLGFWPVYEREANPPFSNPIAVHNGYLGQALEFGLPFLIITGWFLIKLMSASLRCLRGISTFRHLDAPLTRAAAAATAGLFILQSATHNASIFTEDASCLVMLALVLAGEIQMRKSASVISERGIASDVEVPGYSSRA